MVVWYDSANSIDCKGWVSSFLWLNSSFYDRSNEKLFSSSPLHAWFQVNFHSILAAEIIIDPYIDEGGRPTSASWTSFRRQMRVHTPMTHPSLSLSMPLDFLSCLFVWSSLTSATVVHCFIRTHWPLPLTQAFWSPYISRLHTLGFLFYLMFTQNISDSISHNNINIVFFFYVHVFTWSITHKSDLNMSFSFLGVDINSLVL